MIAVAFKSKYGTTEKYAKWIAEEVGADIYPVDEIKADDLEKYDTVVYCGGLYVGGIMGLAFIKKNYWKFRKKKVIVVAVGSTLKKGDAIAEIKNKNFSEAMKTGVKLFILRGGLNYPQMHIFDRFLMFLLVTSIKFKKQSNLDDDSKGILATYGKVVDFTNKKTIAPIVHAITKV
ncbi:MAG: flavodoxin domain-containing protein [Pelosinus sp.]|nr:flavodoxin domain-containing protein [Pelosinus sp.]